MKHLSSSTSELAADATPLVGPRWTLAGNWWRSACNHPLLAVCSLIIAVFVMVGLAANQIAPHRPNAQHLTELLQGPSGTFPLGTDNLGRDILSRTMVGAQTSLVVGLGVMMLSTALATGLGSITGYAGGAFDLIVQRIVAAFLAIPPLILMISIIAILGPGLWQIIIVVSVFQMIASSRVIRSSVLLVMSTTYVESARVIGAGHARILLRHVMPNILAVVIIVASLTVAFAILIEASLSFLGFGLPPPNPTWGGMLAGDARQYMFQAPLMAVAPGIALSAVVFSINVIGDGVRDILDPRLRGARG